MFISDFQMSRHHLPTTVDEFSNGGPASADSSSACANYCFCLVDPMELLLPFGGMLDP